MRNIMLGDVGHGMNWYNKKLVVDSITNVKTTCTNCIPRYMASMRPISQNPMSLNFYAGGMI